MPRQCNTKPREFESHRRVSAVFDRGLITSDVGPLGVSDPASPSLHGIVADHYSRYSTTSPISLGKAAPQPRQFIQEKAVRRRPLSDAQRSRNRIQSKIRAKVEHPFHIMKWVFGFTMSVTGDWPRTPIGCRLPVRW